DLYQGTEFWDFSLVDPDNRRPVDYPARERALDQSIPPAELLAHWQNGHIKQALIAQALDVRNQYPELFDEGVYQPLQVLGQHAERVMAFARIREGTRAIVVVPRVFNELLGTAQTPFIN